jgi:hypothetical protein
MHHRINQILLMILFIPLMSSNAMSARIEKVVVTGTSVNQDMNKAVIEAKDDAKRQAIERVSGVKIKSSSLVSNYQLISDLVLAETIAEIKDYRVLYWEVENLIKEKNKDPVVQLKVKMEVTVKESDIDADKNFQIKAKLNKQVFYDDEKIIIKNLQISKDCFLYIISISGDSVNPILPNKYVKEFVLRPNEKISFPTNELSEKGLSLIAKTSKDRGVDYEQLLIIATKFNNSIFTSFLIDSPTISIQDFSKELIKIPLNQRVIQILDYETRKRQ